MWLFTVRELEEHPFHNNAHITQCPPPKKTKNPNTQLVIIHKQGIMLFTVFRRTHKAVSLAQCHKLPPHEGINQHWQLLPGSSAAVWLPSGGVDAAALLRHCEDGALWGWVVVGGGGWGLLHAKGCQVPSNIFVISLIL